MSYNVIFNFLSDKERKELISLSKNIDWMSGRQNTGYLKSKVNVNVHACVQELVLKSLKTLDKHVNKILQYDCYLLKYPINSSIPIHTDKGEYGFNHWRLNAIVNDCETGGELNIENRKVYLANKDAYVFRPDLYSHSVSKIKKGTRLVWSVGCLESTSK